MPKGGYWWIAPLPLLLGKCSYVVILIKFPTLLGMRSYVFEQRSAWGWAHSENRGEGEEEWRKRRNRPNTTLRA